jgi:hypothetical protein
MWWPWLLWIIPGIAMLIISVLAFVFDNNPQDDDTYFFFIISFIPCMNALVLAIIVLVVIGIGISEGLKALHDKVNNPQPRSAPVEKVKSLSYKEQLDNLTKALIESGKFKDENEINDFVNSIIIIDKLSKK